MYKKNDYYCESFDKINSLVILNKERLENINNNENSVYTMDLNKMKNLNNRNFTKFHKNFNNSNDELIDNISNI